MHAISLWVTIPYTLFVGFLAPVYWILHGPQNFLWFSDLALFATLAAFWLRSRFLLSMMATGVLLFDIVWNFIFFTKLVTGAGPEGVVGYMFDPANPLWVRALSLFHVALPPLQLWGLRRLGYEPRAWKAQAVLGAAVLLLTYAVTGPEENINWVYGFGAAPQQSLPPLAYLGLAIVVYPALVCWPTHLVLKKLFLK